MSEKEKRQLDPERIHEHLYEIEGQKVEPVFLKKHGKDQWIEATVTDQRKVGAVLRRPDVKKSMPLHQVLVEWTHGNEVRMCWLYTENVFVETELKTDEKATPSNP